MQCNKCKKDLFLIQEINDCDTCEHNGWYNGETYQHTRMPKTFHRSQVEQEGECNLGRAFGSGCWIIICNNCKEMFNMPTMEE